MLYAPVSFLVETGSGVSLLNGRIWDRISQKDIRIDAIEYHNLVGVDGHPIQVHGSACLPVLLKPDSSRSLLLQMVLSQKVFWVWILWKTISDSR